MSARPTTIRAMVAKVANQPPNITVTAGRLTASGSTAAMDPVAGKRSRCRVSEFKINMRQGNLDTGDLSRIP
ncbi:hypothetical protein GCM10010205_73510 [Streptomyces nojiriensis]|nr:hypothetical protein GCM10010205_73510 [Streptomyces nojiriensis]